MNKVLSGLFVGNYRDSKDACQLERHKISHIVAIHDAARRVHLDKEYLCIMASDSPYQNLSQYFSACNDFIHSARVQGGNVLIHCLAGMSRSVTIVVAYIMSITPFQLHEAQKVVRGARPVSNPNSGFQKQLQEFETLRLFEERRRLLEKFPGTTFLESDAEQCHRLLVSYNNLLLARSICEGHCASARVCPTGTCRARLRSPRLTRLRSADISSNSPEHSTVTSQLLAAASSASAPSSASSSPSRSGSIASSSSNSGKSSPIHYSSPTISKSPSPSSPSPNSPKSSWERHYGCWKSHIRSQSDQSGIPSPSNSTPASPIHYRISGKNRRSDSSVSIASVTSLPARLPNTTGQDGKSPLLTQRYQHNQHNQHHVSVSSGSSSSSSSPAASSGVRTCPPTPRRMPATPTKVNNIRGNSNRSRNLEQEDETLTVVLHQAVPNNIKTTTTTNKTSSTWTSTSRGRGFQVASAVTSTSSPPAPTPPTPSRSTASGITRWVMKRSAYRYTLENSFNK